MNHTRRTLGLTLGATVTLLAFIAGCSSPNYPGSDNGKDGMSQAQQLDELLKRPNIDDATARYKKMLGEIRTQLGEKVALGSWQEGLSGEISPGCTNFHDVDLHDAQTVYTTWGSPGTLTETTWPQAVQALLSVSANYGFNTKGMEVNKAPFHDYNMLDAYGAEVSISTGSNSNTRTNTMLTLKTGCHLTAAAHSRGKPDTSSVSPTG